MKHKKWQLSLLFACLLTSTITAWSQQPTSFQKIGSSDETVQDLFPGTHRARPVMADYTNNGHMDIFYGGQDIGGSTGWYYREKNKDTRWGDQADGTFVNPILNADYSDPDVIRVGKKYYMICSEFHYTGIPVLESEDMVNWKIITQVYDRIEFPEYDNAQRYGGGAWAPAIRFHDNKYWVYFCSPQEGLFMSYATDPAGPWSDLLLVKNVSGWEDPCPLWDEDGQAYMGRSQLGGGPIYIHKMNPEGTQLLDEGQKVYEGPVAEGTKLFKKDGYYYISIPEGGVATGWQTLLRSDNIYGPYEKKIVLEQGAGKVNGPHQGALVDTPEGEWWFYHFQSKDPLGRIVHLQPVQWDNGWPMIGQDTDQNGIGEPVKEWKKPTTGVNSPVSAPQTSDDFSSLQLSVQWQNNHNPIDSGWSLQKQPGSLVIRGLKASKLRESKNMFTQKAMGYFAQASTQMDVSGMAVGQRGGLFCTGNKYKAVGVESRADGKYIYSESDGDTKIDIKLTQDIVYFRVFLNTNSNEQQFYYSTDGSTYISIEEPFSMQSGDWKGMRVGLFSYNTLSDQGEASFDWFEYKYDGPGGFQYQEDDTPKLADWHVWNEMAALVKNNGDGTFTLVQEYEANMQVTIYTNALFFDYDNDGNLDLLVSGKGGDWRFPMSNKYVKLYRNMGSENQFLFQEVSTTGFKQHCDEMYFNTLSVGDYNHDGYNDVLIMCYDNDGRSIDLYKNIEGSGRFELQKEAFPAAMQATTNGSVMLGDLNNDGWLDVFFTGYGSQARGIGILLNNQDGTFQDITADSQVEGAFQSQSLLSDVNGDGTLDIVITGHGGNWERYGSIYYNTINPSTQKNEFTLVEAAQNGIVPMNLATLLFSDFNHDGQMDLIAGAYDGSKDLTRVYYQDQQGKFNIDTTYPILSIKDGGINMGDVDGDADMDVIIGGYKGSDTGNAYGSPVRIYENKAQENSLVSNTPPTAPQNVQAIIKDGKLTVTWSPSTDDISSQESLRYNIYWKSHSTGELWMMIPADIQTGQLKVGTDLTTSLSSQVKSYTMTIPCSGGYTVGVQALDQSYAGGSFATFSDDYVGCDNLPHNQPYKIIVQPDHIRVKGEEGKEVSVIGINGSTIAHGLTNQAISLAAQGVYIVAVEGSVFKIAK